MRIKSLFAVAALTLATGSAFAATAYQPTPGESLDYPYAAEAASTAARNAVRQAAVAQNAQHVLTGEAGADLAVFDAPATPSTLTRAQVRAQVLAARADGTLPGVGDDVDYPRMGASSPTGRYDAAEHPVLARIGSWFRSRSASADLGASN